MPAKRRFPDFVVRLPKTRAAIAFARSSHAGQRRRVDGAPFILHPLEVGSLLYHVGAPDHVIAAGVLHDTIEKTAVDAEAISRRFGPRVAAIVTAVSEDERIESYDARKRALREQVQAAGADALMVFAADKISKARELKLPARSHSDSAATRAQSANAGLPTTGAVCSCSKSSCRIRRSRGPSGANSRRCR